MRTKITEEMKVHEEWYKEAKEQTLETLPAFLKKLTEDYMHDYGTICHAMAAGALATCWAINKSSVGGITGYQAGFVMWKFVRNWNYSDNKTGLRVIDYDNLLYPQYAHYFKNKMSTEQWENLKKTAAEKLQNDSGNAHPNVVEHWRSIVNGKVPFGFIVSND